MARAASPEARERKNFANVFPLRTTHSGRSPYVFRDGADLAEMLIVIFKIFLKI